MITTGNMPIRFKKTELQNFNWLYNVAPCFAVSASKVRIITEPRTFYDTMCERFKTANRRISIASLYIGTGPMERKLLEVTKNNMERKCLQFKVLLDYQRGTRGEANSLTLLQDFVINQSSHSNVFLYQTPRLQGSWSKALPARYNELVGLQHMKLYVADDSVLLSGANCSNDYFHRRQDRYIEIEDPDLADFYSELIDEVSKFSRKCEKNGVVDKKPSVNKDTFVQEVNHNIVSLIERWKDKQQKKLTSWENDDIKNIDTWVFPLIQMGEFHIRQDEQVTCEILSSVPEDSKVHIATGYFNLTEQYSRTLLESCKASISLLMAHPNANGFMGASGPAGGIPYAYSLIAKKFWQRVNESNQTDRIQMLEYERGGWTFHAKGLWYYPPGCGVPWATVVGSANLGERSVRRDLEAQAAIFTESPDLQARLHEECSRLHEHAKACRTELQERQIPLWVKATVGLFRTYF